MRIKIRDWDKHFEADRSRQWKSLKWVPIPNKQGLGYKKIMSQKNGPEIFGCWCALVQQASLCDPRGDLSKYSIDDLSINTIIPINILTKAIEFIIQNLDWIEVIENLDINVNAVDKNVIEPAVGSSILFNSIPCNSIPSHLKEIWPKYVEMRKKIKKPMTDEAVKLALDKLDKLSKDPKVQIEIVENSVFNSYQGLFMPKANDFGNRSPSGRRLNEYEIGAASKYDGL